jgi:hypothetical protein
MRPSSFGASFTFTAFTKGKIKADGTNYQSEHANDHYCLKVVCSYMADPLHDYSNC